MAKVKRTRYATHDGIVIVLEEPEPPMGHASGYIPPPVIEFFHDGQQVPFVYQGDE